MISCDIDGHIHMSDSAVAGVNWWEKRGGLTALIVILNLIWLTRLDQINLIGRWRGGGQGWGEGKKEIDVPCPQSAASMFVYTHLMEVMEKTIKLWFVFVLFFHYESSVIVTKLLVLSNVAFLVVKWNIINLFTSAFLYCYIYKCSIFSVK